MPIIHQKVLQLLKVLSIDDQQQVLNFVEFLHTKQQPSIEEVPTEQKGSVSFLTAASKYIGYTEGPADLSSNLSYMEGYGI